MSRLTKEHLKLIAGSDLFTGISKKNIDAFISGFTPRIVTFKCKDTLWREGDKINGIAMLLEGELHSQRFHLDGQVQLLQALQPGDFVNLSAAVSRKKTSPSHIVAFKSGKYLLLPLKQMSEFANSIGIAQTLLANLLALLADETITHIYKTDILTRRTVRGRIFLYLSLMQKRSSDDWIYVGMNKERFAQYLCVERTSLSTELNRMKRAGIIDYHGHNYRILRVDEQDLKESTPHKNWGGGVAFRRGNRTVNRK